MNESLNLLLKETLQPRKIAFWLGVVIMMFIVANFNYVLFHSTIEGFTIVVGVMIFVLASKTYKYSGNQYLLVIGIAYVFIAIVSYLHLITYYGMGIFSLVDANVSTQLWIVTRYMEAFSLLLAPVIARRWISGNVVAGFYFTITIILLAAVLWFKVFPVCFSAGSGLTAFKVISEYITCIMNAAAIVYLQIRKEQYSSLYLIMTAALVFSILAGLSFTLYVEPYAILNFVGHIFRAIALYIIFQGFVLRGLQDPYDVIFKELRSSTLTDPMTGLFNRKGLLEISEKNFVLSKLTGESIGFLLIDLDKFKKVNDHYGHNAGDKVLKQFSKLLKSAIGIDNTAFRVGGDEFLALVKGGEPETVEASRAIRQQVNNWTLADEIVKEMGVSIGWTIWKPGDIEDIDAIMKDADQKMYQEKLSKKYSRN